MASIFTSAARRGSSLRSLGLTVSATTTKALTAQTVRFFHVSSVGKRKQKAFQDVSQMSFEDRVGYEIYGSDYWRYKYFWQLKDKEAMYYEFIRTYRSMYQKEAAKEKEVKSKVLAGTHGYETGQEEELEFEKKLMKEAFEKFGEPFIFTKHAQLPQRFKDMVKGITWGQETPYQQNEFAESSSEPGEEAADSDPDFMRDLLAHVVQGVETDEAAEEDLVRAYMAAEGPIKEDEDQQNLRRDLLAKNFVIDVVEVKATVNMTPKGKKRSMKATVVIGNRMGLAGYARAAADTMPAAVDKALARAYRHLQVIPRYNGYTLYEAVGARVGGTLVKCRPMPEGIFMGNDIAKAVCEAAGMRGIAVNVYRSRTPFNTVKALFQALTAQRTLQDVCDRTGRNLVDVKYRWKYNPEMH